MYSHLTPLLRLGRFFVIFITEFAILTHDKQNCPRCDHRNDSYNWDFKRTKIRMECIACGNHWLVQGENAVTVRAASGTSVVEEKQIENPDWRQEYLDRFVPANLSKNAITAEVFDKKKQFDTIKKNSSSVKNSLFPIHIFSLSVMFLALVSAPQFRALIEPGTDGTQINHEVDFITTASVSSEESIFQISNIKVIRIVRGKAKYVNIKADARNVSGERINWPEFNVFMKNLRGETVQDFSLKANNKSIKPGEIIKINREILDETNSTKTVVIAFKK